MINWLDELTSIFLSPAGSMFFHLGLLFILTINLFFFLFPSISNRSTYSKQILLGLSILILSQLALVVMHGLDWQNLSIMDALLPPLDRAVSALTVIWFIWIWFSYNPNHYYKTVSTTLTIAVLIFFGYSVYSQNASNVTYPFNLSTLDLSWQIPPIILLIIAVILLGSNRERIWGIGLVFILLHLTGHILHILSGNPDQNYSLFLRLANLLAFPFLIPITMRSHQAGRTGRPEIPPNSRRLPVFIPKPVADPQAVVGWIKVAANQENPGIYSQIAEALAHTMQVDICFLCEFRDSKNQLYLYDGYDRYHSLFLPGKTIPINIIPEIFGAIQRDETLFIDSTRPQSDDNLILAEILGLDQTGSVLVVPVSVSGQIWGCILLLSPYYLRPWYPDDIRFITATMDLVGEILVKVRTLQVIPSGKIKDRETIIKGLLYGSGTDEIDLIDSGTSIIDPLVGNQSSSGSINEFEGILDFQDGQEKSQEDLSAQLSQSDQTSLSLLSIALDEIIRLREVLQKKEDELTILNLESQMIQANSQVDTEDAWQSEINHWVLEQDPRNSNSIQTEQTQPVRMFNGDPEPDETLIEFSETNQKHPAMLEKQDEISNHPLSITEGTPIHDLLTSMIDNGLQSFINQNIVVQLDFFGEPLTVTGSSEVIEKIMEYMVTWVLQIIQPSGTLFIKTDVTSLQEKPAVIVSISGIGQTSPPGGITGRDESLEGMEMTELEENINSFEGSLEFEYQPGSPPAANLILPVWEESD